MDKSKLTAPTIKYFDDLTAELELFPTVRIRARALSDELVALAELQINLASWRRDLVRELSKTMSVQDIAAAIGVGASRIYALLADE